MLSNVPYLLVYCAATVALCFAFSTLRLLQLFPYSTWIVVKLMTMISTVELPAEDYWNSLFTWSMFDSIRSHVLLEFQKSVRLGHHAPNPHLASVDGKTRCRLLDFVKKNRPLVVSFCSWTCPVFRTRVHEFVRLVQEFSDVADFVNIYTEEAHPSDGWAFENNVRIPSHRSLEERCQAAQMMLNTVDFRCPVVVDTMDNAANQAYAGFPIRLYVIKEGNIEYAGGVGPTFYSPIEVKQWLQDRQTVSCKPSRHRA